MKIIKVSEARKEAVLLAVQLNPDILKSTERIINELIPYTHEIIVDNNILYLCKKLSGLDTTN